MKTCIAFLFMLGAIACGAQAGEEPNTAADQDGVSSTDSSTDTSSTTVAQTGIFASCGVVACGSCLETFGESVGAFVTLPDTVLSTQAKCGQREVLVTVRNEVRRYCVPVDMHICDVNGGTGGIATLPMTIAPNGDMEPIVHYPVADDVNKPTIWTTYDPIW